MGANPSSVSSVGGGDLSTPVAQCSYELVRESIDGRIRWNEL